MMCCIDEKTILVNIFQRSVSWVLFAPFSRLAGDDDLDDDEVPGGDEDDDDMADGDADAPEETLETEVAHPTTNCVAHVGS